MLGVGGRAKHALIKFLGNVGGVAQAREQLSLAHEALIPRVQRELERHGARVLLAHADGAVEGAIGSLGVPGLKAPGAPLGTTTASGPRRVNGEPGSVG